MATDPFRIRTTTPIRYIIIICLALAAVAAAAGTASAGDIRISGAWARATPPGIDVGAAYFVVANGGASDRLIAASTAVAGRAEFHITTTSDGVTRMRQQHAVDVEGGGETAFAPGGRHVMLLGLKQPLEEGDVFNLALTFEKAGTREVQVQVRGAGHHRSGSHHGGGH